MDKEEILEKNREDNRGADERFRILNQRQSSVMVGVGSAVPVGFRSRAGYERACRHHAARRCGHGLLPVLPDAHETQPRVRFAGSVRRRLVRSKAHHADDVGAGCYDKAAFLRNR